MEQKDLAYFKQKLTEEKKLLKKELESVGRINPDNPADWEAKPSNTEFLAADPNEVADNIDDYEQNTAILKQLEIRWNNVNGALEKIDNGKYGICEISGEPIERERLEANPAARTCLSHKNKESELE